mgnify:CR=1 FL=1
MTRDLRDARQAARMPDVEEARLRRRMSPREPGALAGVAGMFRASAPADRSLVRSRAAGRLGRVAGAASPSILRRSGVNHLLASVAALQQILSHADIESIVIGESRSRSGRSSGDSGCGPEGPAAARGRCQTPLHARLSVPAVAVRPARGVRAGSRTIRVCSPRI